MEVPQAEVTPEHFVHLPSLLCSRWTDPVGLSMVQFSPPGLRGCCHRRCVGLRLRCVPTTLDQGRLEALDAALTRRRQRLDGLVFGVKLCRHTPQMMGPKAHQPLATRIARRRLQWSAHAHVAITYLASSSTRAADAESGPGVGVRTRTAFGAQVRIKACSSFRSSGAYKLTVWG